MPLLGKQVDGVWFTGIVVGPKEFYYANSICYGDPGKTPFGRPTKVVPLGKSQMDYKDFLELLGDLA
jgi:hypothetical protein